MSDHDLLSAALEVIARRWPDDSDASHLHGTLSDFLAAHPVPEDARRWPHPPCDPVCSCGCHVHDWESYRSVAGVCPACGEQHLGIQVWPRDLDASRIHCWNLYCPDPTAAWKILNDTEQEHVVHFLGRRGWTIRHPLKERLADGLEACSATGWMQSHIPAEADTPGTYRMIEDETGWRFVALRITEVAD